MQMLEHENKITTFRLQGTLPPRYYMMESNANIKSVKSVPTELALQSICSLLKHRQYLEVY